MLEDRQAPEELDEQDRQIAAYLQRIYDTRAEDARSLAHVRERLQKISAGTLPVSDPVTTSEAAPATAHSRHRKGADMPFRLIHSTFREGKSWQRRLSVLAAVLLVAVIAGSLALFLMRIHQGGLGSGSGVFTLRPGWAVVASYSGTGSKTISGQDIVEVPRLWGYDYACIGSGKVHISLNGESATLSSTLGFGKEKCSIPTSTVAPLALFLESSSLKIQTIQVTADASTVWHLLIVEATTQPTLTLGPEWLQSPGLGGVASTPPVPYRSEFGPITKSNGQTLQSKTWGIVSVCFGTSHGYVQLTPGVGRVNLPPCDRQTRLQVVHYPAATTVKSLLVYITGDSAWYVQIVGCADERKCGK